MKFLRGLFSVPADQKVSEKQMLRALIATACSILVCMGCMAGSAWAWFSVGLESSGNAITVGRFEPVITVEGLQPEDGEYSLEAGKEYKVTVDMADSQVGGYVTVILRSGDATKELISQRLPRTVDGQQVLTLTFTLKPAENCSMTTRIGWGIPAQPDLADGNAVDFGTAAGMDDAGGTESPGSAESAESAESIGAADE